MEFYCHDCKAFTGDPKRHVESDPFMTGDSWYTETTYRCVECNGEDIEEMVACECCGDALPLDGYDDCAKCIICDMTSHAKIYEPIDYERARSFLHENR